MRSMLPVTLFAAAATVIAAGCGGGSGSGSGGYPSAGSDTTATTGGAVGGTLSGSVGPGFDISMDKATVAAGTHTLTVADQATSHNFRLTGPGGVDVKTDVSGTGTKTFTVDLQTGTYTFVCDAHPSSMNGTLTVT